MSYTKVWIHAVWPTKNRNPFLSLELKKVITEHIKVNAIKKRINIEVIDGYLDHLHCLFQLRPDVSVGETMKWIKGESAFWVNKNKITDFNFG